MAVLRKDRRVLALLTVAVQEGAEIIVPPVVVTQIIRGGAGDAAANLFLRTIFIPFVGERIARLAGRILGESGLRDAADAQVVAEAVRHGPATILTSDPTDIALLCATVHGITVVAI